jgi:hypothetical protein
MRSLRSPYHENLQGQLEASRRVVAQSSAQVCWSYSASEAETPEAQGGGYRIMSELRGMNGAAIEAELVERIPYCDTPVCQKVGVRGVRISLIAAAKFPQARDRLRSLELCMECAGWLKFRLAQLELPLVIN